MADGRSPYLNPFHDPHRKLYSLDPCRRPNFYKGIMGLMDMSYKDLCCRLPAYGIKSDVCEPSELCRATRGFKAPRYDRIRRAIVRMFIDWTDELDMRGEAVMIKHVLNTAAIKQRSDMAELREQEERK